MRFFILSTLLLAASCSASLYGAVSTQYLSQDAHGQYSYGYAEPNSQKHETRTADGVTRGGYSYVDGHGITQSVKYSSDPVHGFQVAATNLPVGPAAPAVIPAYYAPAPISYIAPVSYQAAPVSYASQYSAPLQYAAVSYSNDAYGLPQPPQDTPEVAAAKIAHFAAHAQAKANLHHLRKRSTWGYAPSSWSHADAAAPVIHNGVPVDTPEVQQAKAAHFAAYAAAAHGSPQYAPAQYSPAPYAAPVIHNGVPVDTPEVQQAKAAHFAAYAAAAHGSPQYAPAQYSPALYAAPVIHNGVPVDTPEVQHAKAAHFAAVAEAKSRSYSSPSYYSPEPANYGPAHSGAYHIPVIQNGVPVETSEVQHAKAAHFAAVAEAQSRSGYGHESYSNDNSWDNGQNSWDNGHRDW